MSALPVSGARFGFWVSVCLAPIVYFWLDSFLPPRFVAITAAVLLSLAATMLFSLYKSVDIAIFGNQESRERARSYDGTLMTTSLLLISVVIFIPESSLYDPIRAVLFSIFTTQILVKLPAQKGVFALGKPDYEAKQSALAEMMNFVALPLGFFVGGFALIVMYYGRFANGADVTSIQLWLGVVITIGGFIWLLKSGSAFMISRRKH